MQATPNNVIASVAPYVVPIDPATPVLDFEKSKGPRFYDRNVEKLILDFASHFASLPLGYNHPGFFEAEFERELLQVSRIRVANLDVLSDSYVKFFDTFRRIVGLPGFEKYFFIDGGALAIENALKTAFDWKVRRNIRLGKGERGTEVLHFREAFHGRTGYTMSLTNTADPNKTKLYPKFNWPRVLNPKVRFPLEGENLRATIDVERTAMNEIEAIFKQKADDIAAILIEPHQGEGGDNHFRPEFLQFLRRMADTHDTILIFDEVQCGMGMSGKMWACEHSGVLPDIIAFAKKAQVGGIMCSNRILEEPDNVFVVPSRISSTWGSSLTDMVRCRKYLDIIEAENLVEHADKMGKQIVERLQDLAARTELIENVRGLGLLIAFDMVNPETRSEYYNKLYDNGLMVLVCGDKSIRFRPHLNVTQEAVDEAFEIIERTLRAIPVPMVTSN